MIPVLDARADDFAAELRRASREVGFVSVVGHGIPEPLFDRVRSTLRTLFAFSDEQKRALMIEPRNYRGFIPLGFFTPNRVEAGLLVLVGILVLGMSTWERKLKIPGYGT